MVIRDMKNTTDYVFPDGWGLYTNTEKSRWYTEERCFRQAVMQSDAGMMPRFDKHGALLHQV